MDWLHLSYTFKDKYTCTLAGPCTKQTTSVMCAKDNDRYNVTLLHRWLSPLVALARAAMKFRAYTHSKWTKDKGQKRLSAHAWDGRLEHQYYLLLASHTGLAHSTGSTRNPVSGIRSKVGTPTRGQAST